MARLQITRIIHDCIEADNSMTDMIIEFLSLNTDNIFRLHGTLDLQALYINISSPTNKTLI